MPLQSSAGLCDMQTGAEAPHGKSDIATRPRGIYTSCAKKGSYGCIKTTLSENKGSKGVVSTIAYKERDTSLCSAIGPTLEMWVYGVCRLGSMSTLQIHIPRASISQSSTKKGKSHGSPSGPHNQIGGAIFSQCSRCCHAVHVSCSTRVLNCCVSMASSSPGRIWKVAGLRQQILTTANAPL